MHVIFYSSAGKVGKGMKHKFSLKKVIGVSLIVCSGLIAILSVGVSFSSKMKLDNLLKITPSYKDDTGEVMNYEVMSQDQTVIEVTEGVSSIEIPTLGIKAPILDGTTSNILGYAVGRFTNTAKIGEEGNVAMCGHSSSIYNCIFNDLDKIKIGTQIYMTTATGQTFIYYCTGKQIVEPEEMSVLDQPTEKGKFCTIITCTDNGKRRLCILGKIMGEQELAEFIHILKGKRYSALEDELVSVQLMNFEAEAITQAVNNAPVWHTYKHNKVRQIKFRETNFQQLRSVVGKN